jgi:hypothetical protein
MAKRAVSNNVAKKAQGGATLWQRQSSTVRANGLLATLSALWHRYIRKIVENRDHVLLSTLL